MRAGASGPFQWHREKDETFHLLSGQGLVRWALPDDTIQEHLMTPGESFHIPPGAPHQFEALEDCVILEASTPHFDDRIPYEEAQHG